MNILIPHQWLLEHLDTEAKPKKIQELLSLSGPSVERIYERENDSVYDIEVTTNRVDSMSVRGIAREAAVILQQAGINAKLKNLQLSVDKNIKPKTELPLPKINNDDKLNKRTLCVILKNVKRTPTPTWMAEKLTQVEMNIHDSAIDITNYVTHDLGHPCHAFDYDKLMATGGEINITEAKPKEKFQTLDGEEFETIGGEVVFKNGQGIIIDLPSIKGTTNTSIDESTKNILLLIESIKAEKVRFASMTHAIRTVAAQLMEKNVDPHLGETVIRKGIELYQNICQAEVGSKIYDYFPGEKDPQNITVEQKLIDSYLGIQLDTKTITKILQNLGCAVKVSNHTYTITPPTFRPDLSIGADIVEEVARIYGYHNLPSVLMPTAIPTNYPKNTNFELERTIKRHLSAIGWQEVYTYSMVSEKIALQSGFQLNEHLKIDNYLTEDRVYMRRSLTPSLREVMEQNSKRKKLSIFELAKVYHPKSNDLPEEKMMLTMVSSKNLDEVRGDFDYLLEKFYLNKVRVVQDENAQAKIYVQDGAEKTQIGLIRSIDKYFVIEVGLEKLIKLAKTHPEYQPLPKTASILENLTFTLVDGESIGDVIELIIQSDPTVKRVELEDTYQNNSTFAIEFWDPTKNLTKNDVAPIRSKIVNEVINKFSAQLVGQIE
jgi:phenylalanyl-tRNA synthetase beta chain